MKSRRGLSSVVGMVFAIVALTSVVAYISYSVNIINNYNQAVLSKNQGLSDSSKEKFQIASVTIVKSKLNITLGNTGTLPINFTKIWVQNTTTTDWDRSYAPTKNVVSPGATLTNLGQSIPLYINTANSYNVKIVTSRGTSQSFSVNSASAAPLNIQLLAAPSTVVTGFTSELLMIVTNNQTGTLTNLSPQTPTNSNPAACSLGTVNPPSINTLPPGGTAIFKWDVTGAGTVVQSCTLTASLVNGYPGQTAQTTLTVSPVKFASTNLAQSSGILTINYTTFKWTQGGSWHNNWDIPHAVSTVMAVNVTNNNATGTFYFDKNTQVYFSRTGGSNAYQFPMINATTLATPPGVTSYSCGNPNNYCLSVSPGQTVTLYFGSPSSLGQADTYEAMTLIYGKYANSRSGAGTPYAQTIPYLAILAT